MISIIYLSVNPSNNLFTRTCAYACTCNCICNGTCTCNCTWMIKLLMLILPADSLPGVRVTKSGPGQVVQRRRSLNNGAAECFSVLDREIILEHFVLVCFNQYFITAEKQFQENPIINSNQIVEWMYSDLLTLLAKRPLEAPLPVLVAALELG